MGGEEQSTQAVRAAPVIRVLDIEKRFDDVVALAGVSLEVHRGECFGLLGPNGAGKTTLCDLLMGMTSATAGRLELLGLTWAENARELRQRVTAQFQEASFYGLLSVEETVRLFRKFYRRGLSVDEAIGLVGLEDKRHAWVRTLSGGQRQRMSVACALVSDPEIVLLDEPTAGLDPTTRRSLWGVVERYRAQGRTILFTTHYMEEAERLCDRIAIIDHGKVVACGSPSGLIAEFGGDHIVDLRLAGSDYPPELLENTPGVRVVLREEGSLRLAMSGLQELPHLLVALAGRQVTVLDIATRQPTLDDVFMRLTGRSFEPGSRS